MFSEILLKFEFGGERFRLIWVQNRTKSGQKP